MRDEITFESYITRYNKATQEEIDFAVTVSATLESGCPATRLSPSEPPIAEIYSVVDSNGNEIELTEEEDNRIQQEAFEEHADRYQAAYAEYFDYRYDRMREEGY